MNLPDKSFGSYLKGIWLVFQDGHDTIRISSGSLTGIERIFINEELVSKKRSLKKESAHSFQNKRGEVFQLDIKVVNSITGIIHYDITKNGRVFKNYEVSLIKKSGVNWQRLLLFVMLGLILGGLHVFLQMPKYVMYSLTIGIALGSVIPVYLSTKYKIRDISFSVESKD